MIGRIFYVVFLDLILNWPVVEVATVENEGGFVVFGAYTSL